MWFASLSKPVVIGLLIALMIVIIFSIWMWKGKEESRSGAVGRKWPVASVHRSYATASTGAAQAAAPVVNKRRTIYSTDGNAPGSQAYDEMANDVYEEDLEAITNRKLGIESKVPMPEPLTDDPFRYVGDFEIKKDDPYLSNPMTRVTTNKGANPGINVWTTS